MWALCRQPPKFSGNDVHVWRAELEIPETELPDLQQLLSEDEQERAVAFYFDQHRKHYIAGRAMLRILLGNYLECAPEEIEFTYNTYGKPTLSGNHKAHALGFNVSHSYGMALFAFVLGRGLGVDIEKIRPRMLNDKIPEHFFAPEEVNALRKLPQPEQVEAFFNCWTRKEAFVKAHGKGLALPLNGFVVSCGSEPELLSTAFDPPAAEQWKLYSLAPFDGYAAALAIEGQAHDLKLWNWEKALVPTTRAPRPQRHTTSCG